MLHRPRIFDVKIALALGIVLIAIPKVLFSATPPNTTLSIDASAVVGNNGWYTSSLPITLTATAGTSAVRDISHWIDAATPTVSTTNPTTRTLIAQGTHTLRYFATDIANQKEATRSFDYKIDLVTPGNWNTFAPVRSGNSHTFTITVNVTDKTSGIDPATAYFQYSVDDGATWGYYSNLTQCNSTWNDNQWRSTSVTPNTPGALTAQINIPSTDYCNGNWAETKYIRIKVKDMAGLESTKQYALMSPWLQTSGGNVYSNGMIDMLTENGPGATGIVETATDTINNMTSTQGWNLKNYPVTSQSFYTTFYAKFGSSATALPNSIPITNNANAYETDDLSLSGSAIPNSLATTKRLGHIIFVQGDLFIENNIQLDPTSTILWIVSGDVGIKGGVTRADGIYFVDGEFNSAYNGSSNNQLTINGAVAAQNGITFSRSLNNNDNLTTPAEIIAHTSSIYLNDNILKLIGSNSDLTWKEYVTY